MAEQSVIEHPRRKFPDYAYHREKIWWLASYPKSGNTWLRMFLTAYARGGFVNINMAEGLGTSDLNAYFYQAVSPRPIERLRPEEILLIRPAALLHMTSFYNNPKAPFFLKTHSMYKYELGTIPHPLTHGAIYLVRDPRDIAVSYAKHCGKPLDLIIAAMGNAQHALHDEQSPIFQLLGTWSMHVQSWLDATLIKRLVIRYEDLLEQPRESFFGILKFIQYQLNQPVFDRALAATTFDALRAQEDRIGFKERRCGDRFFNQGKTGAWKDTLSKAQSDRIESDHREVMQTMGYL